MPRLVEVGDRSDLEGAVRVGQRLLRGFQPGLDVVRWVVAVVVPSGTGENEREQQQGKIRRMGELPQDWLDSSLTS